MSAARYRLLVCLGLALPCTKRLPSPEKGGLLGAWGVEASQLVWEAILYAYPYSCSQQQARRSADSTPRLIVIYWRGMRIYKTEKLID